MAQAPQVKLFHLYPEGGPAPPMTSSICVFHLGITLVALWKAEGEKPKEERTSYLKLRPVFNRGKRIARSWMAGLSQTAVKGGLIDAEDAIRRFYKKEARAPRFHGHGEWDAFRCDNGAGTVKATGRRCSFPPSAAARSA